MNDFKYIKEIGTDGYIDYAYVNSKIPQPGFVPENYSLCSSDTLISPNICIKVNGNAIGAVQNFDFTENSDGIVNVFCGRVWFAKQSIIEAFTGKLHITSDSTSDSFDIDLVYPDRTTTIHGVKIKNTHTSIAVDRFVIMQNAYMEGASISTKMFEPSQSTSIDTES